MNIYKARNIQKNIMKNAKLRTSGKICFYQNKLYYSIVAEVITPDQSQSFLDGQLTISLGLNEATTIRNDHENGIFHRLLFLNGNLCDLILIEIDD